MPGGGGIRAGSVAWSVGVVGTGVELRRARMRGPKLLPRWGIWVGVAGPRMRGSQTGLNPGIHAAQGG